MILKTKYGTKIDTAEIGEGYGKFGEYMRKYIDKEWGMAKEREVTHTKKYRVTLSGYAEVTGVIMVDAKDEEEAKELAVKEKDTIDWDIEYNSGVDSVEVYDIEEETEDD